MHPLRGPRLKLSRADKHLNAFKDAINAFIATKPYTFVAEPNPAPPHYIIVARIHRSIPDEELGLIVGDFAHNARSALDLLIQPLSTLALDDDKRFNLQFPIFDYPTGSKGYASHVESYLCGIEANYRTIIEDFQPYKRTDGFENDALGILQAINNADKHRIIHVVSTVAQFHELTISGPAQLGALSVPHGSSVSISQGAAISFGDGFAYAGIGDGTITQDRTVVGRITAGRDVHMNMHPNGEILVKFDEGSKRVKGRPVMDTLTFIHDRVKEVIGKFDPFFPT